MFFCLDLTEGVAWGGRIFCEKFRLCSAVKPGFARQALLISTDQRDATAYCESDEHHVSFRLACKFAAIARDTHIIQQGM